MPDERTRTPVAQVFAVLLAVLGVALLARVNLSVPGSPVPQSAQSLGVLLVGVALGGRMGAVALLAYLLLGGVGLPVFADGASGWEHLTGPTSGYLFSFVLSAALIGWLADQERLDRFLPALLAMFIGHGIILGLGWVRLGSQIGLDVAYEQGVAPFIVGGIAKSALAALVAVLVSVFGKRPRNRGSRT